MKKILLCLFLSSALASSSSQDDHSLSGTWEVHNQSAGGSKMSCTISQKGSELTGTCTAAGRPDVKIVGSVEGNKVGWVINSEYNGSPLTMKYEGTVDRDSKITGTMTIVEFLISGDFDATRANGSSGPAASQPTVSAAEVKPDVRACPEEPFKKASSLPGTPDFGPNVILLNPSMSPADMQCQIDNIAKKQQKAEYGLGRYAIFFMPGAYTVDAKAAYYTQIAGLGLSPDDVTIHGHVQSMDPAGRGSILVSFWRSAENMLVIPPDGVDRWAVSQAAPFRRMHVKGDLVLHENSTGSGGFIADSKIEGTVDAARQQQWFIRNSSIKEWKGGMWNMVFVGVTGAPPTSPESIQLPEVITFQSPVISNIAEAPLSREKPFLYVDNRGAFRVFVPALMRKSKSVTWGTPKLEGKSLPTSRFFLAHPEMTAAEINRQLSAGKNLILTPGIYRVTEPIRVTHPNTIVMGLGMATIEPENGSEGLTVSDVGGVEIAGILFNAGPVNSEALLQVGPGGASKDHKANPTFLYDIFARIGDQGKRSATRSVEINNSDVVIDDSWLWRADHGPSIGWDANVGANGLVVNGNDVTAYGLFVEHYQQVQVLWNGDRGRTFFYQNEIASNPAWPEARVPGSTMKGYPAYKVADKVTQHEAWGLGSYFFNSQKPFVVQGHSFEVPEKPGVVLHNMMTFTLGMGGKTEHVINDYGPAASQMKLSSPVSLVTLYPPKN